VDDVKQYLEQAGATKIQLKEVMNYIKIVPEYEKEFAQKSTANKT
jgi:hypothetical protein